MYSIPAPYETQPLHSISPAYLPVPRMYSFQSSPNQRHHQRPPRPVYRVNMFRNSNTLPEAKPYGTAALPQSPSSLIQPHHHGEHQQPLPPLPSRATITKACAANYSSQRTREKTRRSFADYLEYYARREAQICGRLSKPRRREREMASFNYPQTLPPPPPPAPLYWAQNPFERSYASGSGAERDSMSSHRNERRWGTNDQRERECTLPAGKGGKRSRIS